VTRLGRRAAWSAAVAGLLLLPALIHDDYFRHLLVLAAIYAILALSYDLLLGRTGYFSLGHIGFFGIGAYVVALVHQQVKVPFLAGMVVAALATGLCGLGIGLVSLRLRGPYFVIVTLGFTQIIRLVIVNWVDVTQGPMGIAGIPKPSLSVLGVPLVDGSTRVGAFYIAAALLLVTVFVIDRLSNSYVGRAWTGIRENAELAQTVGISYYRYSLLAFVISTMLVGLAGGFYAHYVTFVGPEIISFGEMVAVITMVVVGGEGTLVGPLAGAVVFTLLPEYLRVAAAYRMLIFGGLLLLMVLLMPEGIIPFGRRMLALLPSRPRRSDARGS
jgi:branched-chain amino acid transport system permease protein